MLTPAPSSPAKGWWVAGAILLALSLILHVVGWMVWRQSAVDHQALAQLRQEIQALQSQAQTWQQFKSTLNPILQDIDPLKQALERCQTEQAQLQTAIKQVQDQQKADKAWFQQQWRNQQSAQAAAKSTPAPAPKSQEAINNPDVYW
jgi:septal ring factor EnvC (AmiA/AmiB activator)